VRLSLPSLGALACIAALVVACGDDDDAGNGSTSSNEGGKYGTGLELGKVLSEAKVGASVEPWYRWNGDTCEFDVADDHPADYKAELREVTGGESKIGYMHYGNSDPFGVANSKSVEAVAEKAGMELDVYNLKFPSRTEPQAAARSAVVKQDRGVLQANLDPSVLPEYYKILEGEGCIPSVQLYIPLEDRPSFGNHWPDVGKVIGSYIAEEAQARNWDPAETALVQCRDPDNGPSVEIVFEEIPKTLEQDGFAIPKDNQFNVICKLSEAQAGYRRVTDWFTGHPDFKHVAFTATDSPRMQEMIRAVNREGRPDEDTILVAGADDESSRASVRKGDQDMSVAFFADRFGEWLVPMIQDLMAGNPVPKFVGTELIPLTRENIDEHYPDE
jgi:ribose transport system substrate-binding protein